MRSLGTVTDSLCQPHSHAGLIRMPASFVMPAKAGISGHSLMNPWHET